MQRMLAEEEYRRLLYVGMTRAEDRLIVCGYFGKRTPPNTTWHAIVSRALTGEGLAETRPHPADSETTVHRYRVSQSPERPAAAAEKAAAGAAAEAMPAWLTERLSEPPPLPAPLSPSRAMALIEDAPAPPGRASPVLDAADASFAIRRGLATHRLLQMLPEVEPARRDAAARRYLERAGADWEPGEREAVLAAVAAVLGDDGFAPIFSPGSRAEVAVMGTLDVRGRSRVVSGSIDRLATTGGPRSDRRLQDEPAAAGDAGRRRAGLSPADGALSGAAFAALPWPQGRGGAALHRGAAADRVARRGAGLRACPTHQAVTQSLLELGLAPHQMLGNCEPERI